MMTSGTTDKEVFDYLRSTEQNFNLMVSLFDSLASYIETLDKKTYGEQSTDIDELFLRIDSLTRRNKDSESIIESLNHKVGELNGIISDLTSKNNSLSSAVSRQEVVIEELQKVSADLDVDYQQSVIDDLKKKLESEVQTASELLSEASNEIEALKSENLLLTDKNSQLENKYRDVSLKYDGFVFPPFNKIPRTLCDVFTWAVEPLRPYVIFADNPYLPLGKSNDTLDRVDEAISILLSIPYLWELFFGNDGSDTECLDILYKERTGLLLRYDSSDSVHSFTFKNKKARCPWIIETNTHLHTSVCCCFKTRYSDSKLLIGYFGNSNLIL